MPKLKVLLCFVLTSACFTSFSQSWVSEVAPTPNALNINTNNFFTVTFSEDIDQASLSDSSVVVYGDLSGFHESILIYDAGTRFMSISPTPPFIKGELISITLTTAIKNTNGDAMPDAYTWNCRVKTDVATGNLIGQAPILTGTNPYAITAADFDNDDRIDLATANRGAGTVSILENTDSAGFSSANTIPVGNLPEGITAGDFNRDGLFDLAVANNASNSVSILINSGDFNFSNDQTLFNVSTPHGIQNRDIDGDGDLDIITANFGDGRLGIYTNDGTGNFSLATSTVVGGFPERPLVRDFDNDGDIDLASPNFTGGFIRFFAQEAPLDYSTNSTPGVGQNPHIPAAEDLNADGFVDVIVPNSASGNLSIIMNDGDFSFTPSFVASSSSPWSVTPFDVDGDEDIDLAVCRYLNANGQIRIWKNDGEGNFPIKETLNTDARPHQTVAADFDNDGTIDLAVCNENSNNVRVFLNEQPDTEVDEVRGIVSAFSIFPNPVRDRATIRFDLKNKAQVQLVVLDAFGREVYRLNNRKLGAGWQTLHWNTTLFEAGIYFIGLRVDNQVIQEKVVLLK